MPKVETDYSNTIIYKICCKDPTIRDIYIGHTTNFTQRKTTHKNCCTNENDKNYNRYVYKFIRNYGGWDNWSMIQIEIKNCKDKRDAELTEHNWIETLKASLNTNNPYAMCKEEPQVYKQNWYKENKEEILEKTKKRYEENREQKLEYQKQYAKEYKEEISEKQKEYREKNKEKLAEQKKIYREQHKEEASNAHKEWREANKEKLKEQRAQIVTCECGNQFTINNKNRHLKSKVHISFENKLCGIIEQTNPEVSEEEQLQILRQKQKEYRDKNAEKIRAYKKMYNANKKQEKLDTNIEQTKTI